MSGEVPVPMTPVQVCDLRTIEGGMIATVDLFHSFEVFVSEDVLRKFAVHRIALCQPSIN